MLNWILNLHKRYRDRIAKLATSAQYGSSPEPKPLQVVRRRSMESVVGTRLTSIHSATWCTSTNMKASFVYGLSDGSFVRFGDWIGKAYACDEVVLNESFYEVKHLLYEDVDRDPRWYNREIIDLVVPRAAELRHGDSQGLLLDSGCCIFHSASEPRGCSPSVALSAINNKTELRLFLTKPVSSPTELLPSEPMNPSDGRGES
jgi:hypothetical protein